MKDYLNGLHLNVRLIAGDKSRHKYLLSLSISDGTTFYESRFADTELKRAFKHAVSCLKINNFLQKLKIYRTESNYYADHLQKVRVKIFINNRLFSVTIMTDPTGISFLIRKHCYFGSITY